MTQKLCECGCGGLASLAVRTRNSKGYTKGQPMRFVEGHQNRSTMSINERFWSKVDKQGPLPPAASVAVYPEIADECCWLWTAGSRGQGYGDFRIGYENHASHRVSWFLEHGDWPNPCALHKCDNRACVRPSHLFEGTTGDNNRDTVVKDRGNRARGETNGSSFLTAEDIVQIRKLYAQGHSQSALGRKFGMHHCSVWQIVHRLTWRHV